MSEVLLNLDFASYLFLDPRLYNLLFVEAFEGEDIVGFDLCADHVHVAKPAFTQWAANVKVVKVPVTGWPFPMEG